MTRYFIHIVNGDGPQPDEVGQEFSSDKVAIAEAAQAAGELMRSEAPGIHGEHSFEVTLADERDATVAFIRVSMSVPVRA